MNRSGATISYDYFKDKLESSKCFTNPDKYYDEADAIQCPKMLLSQYTRVRQLFEYIEDGDLWRWKLKDSKAFSSGLKDLNIEFDANLNPTLFNQLLSLSLDSIIKNGRETLLKKQKLIDDILDQSFEISIGGGSFGKCLAVIADSIPELRSELGHQLATKSQNLNMRGIGAVVYKVPELENDEIVKISLRSIENEDTTPISQNFGGGGHRNASSFMSTVADFERWKVAIVSS
uniref:DHHA1 domain-containing protein n=1 Tax=Kalanchoe fedtschenkoi TaxID=63787 RepID=A0A7N0SWB1_KALFE